MPNTIITNAPDAYDYGWASRSESFEYEMYPGGPVVTAWRVTIENTSDAVYQQGRYQSGSYVAIMEGVDVPACQA